MKNWLRVHDLLDLDSLDVRTATYRPFSRQYVAFEREIIERPRRMPELFPTQKTENYGFYNVGNGSVVPFSVLMTNAIPDLHVTGAGSGGQFFPRYTYRPRAEGDDLFSTAGTPSSPERVDNITDETLAGYRATYGVSVTKDDIFFYIYGLLHSPEYRTQFAADLKKMLPRIPKVAGTDKFQALAKAGRDLSALHVGYETVEPYSLVEVRTGVVPENDEYAKYAVKKMKYGGRAGAWDKSRIIYNSQLTLEGIPVEAQRYTLGARSAIDWIVERYQIKTDKPSGIVNDPNDWSREHEQPRYIIDLIGRVVTVSLETNRIVDSLPGIDLEGGKA